MNTTPKRDLSIHVEVTSNCNSSCLYCGRFVGGGQWEVTDVVNPHIQIGSAGNMSLDAIKNIFDEETSAILYKVVFTGAFGDAQMHPKFFDIVREIGIRTSKTQGRALFVMETNGGMHKPEWWAELHSIVKQYYHRLSRVIFSIDGTDDETHQMYRRGVDWNKVMANAKSYIQSGGNATWQMIEFDHNKHQFELAQTMATEYGFMSFETRRSRNRFITRGTPIKFVPRNTKKKSISEEAINIPEDYVKSSKEIKKSVGIKNETTLDKYLTSCEVSCEWKARNSYSVDYDGRVWQCCHFSMMLHPGWGHVQTPSAEQLQEHIRAKLRDERLDWYLNQYEPDWNDVNRRKFSDIIQHRFFTEDLEMSFENKHSNPKFPRINRCSERCGPASIEFDKKHYGRDFREKFYKE